MLLIPLEHSGRRNGSVTASPSVFHHSSAPPGQLVGGTRRCSVTALPVHCPSAGSISPVSPSLPLPLSPDLAAGALEGRRPCPSLPSARGQAPVSRRAGPVPGNARTASAARDGPLAATNSPHDSLGSHSNKGTRSRRRRRQEISPADNYNGGSDGNNRDRLGPPPPRDGLCESRRNNCERRRG